MHLPTTSMAASTRQARSKGYGWGAAEQGRRTPTCRAARHLATRAESQCPRDRPVWRQRAWVRGQALPPATWAAHLTPKSQSAHPKRKVPCQRKAQVGTEPSARARVGKRLWHVQAQGLGRAAWGSAPQFSQPGQRQAMLSCARGRLLQTAWLRNNQEIRLPGFLNCSNKGRKKERGGGGGDTREKTGNRMRSRIS